MRGARIGDEERDLLGRGDEDVGRLLALALAPRMRRVAGARLDADRQAHLRDRRFEIARDVDGERLERRDIERVDALALDAVREFDEARQEAGQRLAAAGRRDQQHVGSGLRLVQHRELMRARRPAARAEPSVKTSGNLVGRLSMAADHSLSGCRSTNGARICQQSVPAGLLCLSDRGFVRKGNRTAAKLSPSLNCFNLRSMHSPQSTPGNARGVLAIAVPIMLSNVTEPLIGVVNSAVIGQIPDAYYIGAITVGALDLQFHLSGASAFSASAPAGLSAQATGAGDARRTRRGAHAGAHHCRHCRRSRIIALSPLIGRLAFSLLEGSPEVESHAATYFYIRVFSAPFALDQFLPARLVRRPGPRPHRLSHPALSQSHQHGA